MRGQVLALAWPVLIGQLAVMANGVIDTVMAGHLSADDVAAVGLGASVSITVYVGFMGVLLALSPIVAQHYGAGRHAEIGLEFKQALWLALALSVAGTALLLWTDLWLAIAEPPAPVAERARVYLTAAAFGVPASLLFRVFYALNTAISRPKVVMTINLVGVALKVPLNALFMYGATIPGTGWTIPAMGGPGCGVATAIIAWVCLALGIWLLVSDPVYRPFKLGGFAPPHWQRVKPLLALGLPMGGSYIVEITSFTFIALLVARFGAVPAAGHQIASNALALFYMFALAIANATSVLVGQSIGRRRPARARRYARTGIRIAMATAAVIVLALWLGGPAIARLYTSDPAVLAATVPLLALLGIYHLFDSLQTQFAFILRAYKIAVLPMVIYVVSLWGIGLGMGTLLTYRTDPAGPLGALNGANGGAIAFWVCGVASVVLASALLAPQLTRVWRAQRRMKFSR